jgi:hypothetical protein
MEMQDVKILSPPAHLLKHRDMQAIGIADRAVEAQRARPDRLKPRGGAVIAAGKQRDIVAQSYELLREPGDHAFGTTIQLRRNSFSERDICAIRMRSPIPRPIPYSGTQTIGSARCCGARREMNALLGMRRR